MDSAHARDHSLILSGGDLTDWTRALSEFFSDGEKGIVSIDIRNAGTENLSATAGIREVNRWERALRAIERSPITVVALLGGQIGGTAFEVALACDLRMAEPDTVLTWNNDGAVWPSTALYRLVQLMGHGPTRRLTMLGGNLDVPTASVHSLIDVVADSADVRFIQLAEDLADLHDLRIIRQLLAEATHTGYDEALGAHLAACDRYLRRTGSF